MDLKTLSPYALMIATVMVWLGVLYMRRIVRFLKNQMTAAEDLTSIGKFRCETAAKNFNAIRIFYRIVALSLIILIVIFIVDEAARIFLFVKNTGVRDRAVSQLLPELVNVSLFFGLLVGCGFWFMVRDIRNYASDFLKRCSELKEKR